MSGKQVSSFFFNLGQMLEAGLPIDSALQSLASQARGHERAVLTDLRSGIGESRSLSDCCSKFPGLFTDTECALLHAGEQSGQLHRICKLISGNRDEARKIRNRMCLGLLYPALVVHVMYVVMAVFHWIEVRSIGAAVGFFFLRLLIPTYLIIALLTMIFTARRGPFRSIGDFLTMLTPGLAGISRMLARGRFTMVMQAFYEAGISFEIAYPKAADAVTNRRLRDQVMRGVNAIQAGEPLSRAMTHVPLFTSDDIALVSTGEASGKLDACLGQVSKKAIAEAQLRINVFMIVSLVLVFIVIAVAAGALVIGGWLDYFRTINETIDSI